MNAPEQRTITAEVEDVRTEGRTLAGFAALYGQESRDLGGYRETIAPGAFADVLAADPDVYLTMNHSPDKVLARTRSGTLRLSDEARGLAFEADLGDGPTAQDVRDMVRRGDLSGASFRFKVAPGGDSWSGERRTLTRIAELIDLSLATTPAYDGPRVELRSAPDEDTETESNGAERQKGANTMATETDTGAAESRASTETTTETPEATEDRQEAAESRQERPAAGSLHVEERATSAPRRGLAEEFRSAGFPGEVAEIPWQAFEDRAVTWSPSINLLNQVDRQGGAYPIDSRYAWTALDRVPVDSAATSVQVLVQTDQSAATGVVRAIDATTDKAEVSTTIDLQTKPLLGVAAVASGIKNIVIEQDAIRSVIENALRTTINEGLDEVVADTFAASGFQAPGTDNPLVSYRKAITALQADGFNPDTILLTPAAAEELDVMVSGATDADADFVFGAAQFAPDRLFNLRRVVSKAIPAPVVLDSAAYGRLYASPARLASFEENAGRTNTSLVRLELSAAAGVERQSAAVRVASS